MGKTSLPISSTLADSYRNAEYWVDDNGVRVSFRVGEENVALRALMERTRRGPACFITAWNPRGALLDEITNRNANRRLQAELNQQALYHLPGRGTDPAGSWPGEDSFLVFVPDRKLALRLCLRYRQNALVWVAEDGAAELVFANDAPP